MNKDHKIYKYLDSASYINKYICSSIFLIQKCRIKVSKAYKSFLNFVHKFSKKSTEISPKNGVKKRIPYTFGILKCVRDTCVRTQPEATQYVLACRLHTIYLRQ